MDPDHHPAHGGGAVQEAAELGQDLPLPGGKAAGAPLTVGQLHQFQDPGRVHGIGGQKARVQFHPHLTPLAADECGLRDLGDLLDGVDHQGGHAPQGEVVLAAAVEGQGEDGHVVDAPGLEQGRGGARGDPVQVGVELLVELDDGLLLVPAHQEADDDQGLAGAGGGVDVFHPGELTGEFLEGPRDPLGHLLGAGPGHGDEDVDHGHDDLRLLLPGQEVHRQGAEQDGRPGDQGRQGGIDEKGQDAGDEPEAADPIGALGLHDVTPGWSDQGDGLC